MGKPLICPVRRVMLTCSEHGEQEYSSWCWDCEDENWQASPIFRNAHCQEHLKYFWEDNACPECKKRWTLNGLP